MTEMLLNLLLVALVLLIFFSIVRQMLPGRKLVHNGEALTCISQGKVWSRERLYFNSLGVYVYCGRQMQAQYQFADLCALEKDTQAVNHIRVWQLVVQTAGGQRRYYRFCPSVGLGRSGFDRFYRHLLAVRPEAVKSSWRRWLPGV